MRFLLTLLALTLPAAADRLTPVIGSTLMIGWPGDEVTDQSSQLLCQQLSRGEVGGVLFLGHNFKSVADVSALTQYFARCGARFQPLLALDQEGGRVDRLGKLPGEERWPSAATVAARGNGQSVYSAMAARVRALGFNVNFGPVVDLNINPRSPVIGAIDRSYGADYVVVRGNAALFIEAHNSAQVATTLKHYPGHGSARTDSHKGFTDIATTWTNEELAPFAALQDQAGSIMVGHLVHRGLDSSGLPASLSKTMLGNLRRTFQGVLISDDMEMRAITDIYGFEASVQLGLGAGLDLFITANAGPYRTDKVATYHATVRDALDRGLISEADLRAKQRRIERWKP